MIEAGAITTVSYWVAFFIDVPISGVISVFLTSCALAHRLTGLLDENRDNIYVAKLPSRRANLISAASVLAMFLGVLAAYTVIALVREEHEVLLSFSSVPDVDQLDPEVVLSSHRFPSMMELLRRNAVVLVAFFIIGFVYRVYGVLLALCWNACVWGIVLTLLIQRTVGSPDVTSVLRALGCWLALSPHVILEAAADVLMGLSAVFFSRGLFKYGWRSAKMKPVWWACLRIALLSVVCLIVAAAAEAVLLPALL